MMSEMKKSFTQRLDALGMIWKDGKETKQPINDGISPDAYQVMYKPGMERGSLHYFYTMGELKEFIERQEKEHQENNGV